MSFAVILRWEAIVIAITSAVPETRATAIFHIEEPSDSEIAARTTILIQGANF
jgi:hypothetical protein